MPKRMQGLFLWAASGRAIANGHSKTIHPHPTLGESIGMAAEIARGSCTDVPPQKSAAGHAGVCTSPRTSAYAATPLRVAFAAANY
ncbi:hypothetical protein KIK84_12020 [Curvibacter sp. CHRR-16]|uniref:hypothetical protein n=1 Tax=Curvibacter sp. CHRR-16 TaxID=2835872 RepID=UPI001BDA5944|nr:hypothetical protein [Curvibacter sp. CHRR-16]MBT0571056.1 hypothetical protein [Curvibacter sp. CHRR-16]